MKSLRDTLHCNNNPENITSAPRNLDQTTENNTWNLITVRGLAKKIQKKCSPCDFRTIFWSCTTLQKCLFWIKPLREYKMTKNCMYSVLCSCDKVYKDKICCPLKVRQEEHQKAIYWVYVGSMFRLLSLKWNPWKRVKDVSAETPWIWKGRQ